VNPKPATQPRSPTPLGKGLKWMGVVARWGTAVPLHVSALHGSAPVNMHCFPPLRGFGWRAGGAGPCPHVWLYAVKRLPFPPPPVQALNLRVRAGFESVEGMVGVA